MPRQTSEVHQKHLALVIELPDTYTADIDGLREFKDDMSESEFLLNCVGEPSIVRVRMEIAGEKDSSVVEVWGHVREAMLVEPGLGYVTAEPHLTGEQLATHGGSKLMRDGDGCEWCEGGC